MVSSIVLEAFFCYTKKQVSYVMKKNYLSLLRYLQFAIAFVLALFVFFGDLDSEKGLLLQKPICYIPIPLLIVLLGTVVLEFKYCKPWIRFFLMIIAVVTSIYMLQDSLAEANAACFCFGLIAFFVSVFNLFTMKKVKTSNDEEKNVLPIGIYSKKQQITNLVGFTLVLLIAIVTAMLLVKYTNLHYGFICLIEIPIVFVLFMIVVIISLQFNPFFKAIKAVNNQLNFKDFSLSLDQIASSKLHEETINYLEIIRANYMFAYNKKEGINHFEKTIMPTAKLYMADYLLIEIAYAINKEDYNKAHEILATFKEKYPRYNKNKLLTIETNLKIFETKDIIDNIETLFPTNTKNNFLNINNASILATYYLKQDNREKALNYANYLLNIKTDMVEFYNLANDIISTYN